MSNDTEKLEHIDKVLLSLKIKEGREYLTDDDWERIEEVLKKESSRLSKALDFRVEAKRRRESLQPAKLVGRLRPSSSLSRTQGRRDPSELPSEIPV